MFVKLADGHYFINLINFMNFITVIVVQTPEWSGSHLSVEIIL